MIAVITADFIRSSYYSEALLSKVLRGLKKEFDNLEKESGHTMNFSLYRGDSFQGIIKNPENALHIALRLKCAVNKISVTEKGKTPEADLKIAIGIGELEFEGDSIEESNGQAFRFSGRTLDQMKYESRQIRLKTPASQINEEFDVSLYLMDQLTHRWSAASAEVVYYLLMGWKEKKIAQELNISQSAVNQRKKAAGWEPISMLLKRYHSIISKTFTNE